MIIATWMGCKQEEAEMPWKAELAKGEASFFGDSTIVFLLNELQNGYRISIIHNEQLSIIHFERGDSINRYCAIHELPYILKCYVDTFGVINTGYYIPVLKQETLGGSEETPEMFFMDVNFDGEEEFVVKSEGYNRHYYACFDLVKGYSHSSSPGLLEAIHEPPYDNIVSGAYGEHAYTMFDFKNKGIYIYEQVGCCSTYETWAKYFEEDMPIHPACVRVIKKVIHEDWADGTKHIETQELVDDTLRRVKYEVI